MKKSNARFFAQLGGTAALFSLPFWVVAQTPPSGPPAGVATPERAPATPPEPPSAAEGGYLIGLSFGEQIHRIGITNEISVDDISRGVREALGGKKLAPGEQQKLQVFVKSIVDGIVAKNKAAAKEFLEKNGKEKGVKTTSSGLEYQILIPGDAKAASPQPTDTVSVQYRGKLLDGSEFDSSYAHGEAASFQVNGVIKGWQEALVLMKPGSKWKLWVPPELGYDAQPRPGIPAGSLLVFEVELQSVKPPAPKPAATPPAPSAPPAPPSAPAEPAKQ